MVYVHSAGPPGQRRGPERSTRMKGRAQYRRGSHTPAHKVGLSRRQGVGGKGGRRGRGDAVHEARHLVDARAGLGRDLGRAVDLDDLGLDGDLGDPIRQPGRVQRSPGLCIVFTEPSPAHFRRRTSSQPKAEIKSWSPTRSFGWAYRPYSSSDACSGQRCIRLRQPTRQPVRCCAWSPISKRSAVAGRGRAPCRDCSG